MTGFLGALPHELVAPALSSDRGRTRQLLGMASTSKTVHSAVIGALADECNWDPGWGFVTFASEEAAEAARASLDGTPGPVDGCNLFVEYEEIREAADGAADGAAADGAAAAAASHAEGMKVNF